MESEGYFEVSVYDKDGNLKYYDRCSQKMVHEGVNRVLRDKGYFDDPSRSDPRLGFVGNLAYSLYIAFVLAILILEIFAILWAISYVLGF